MAARNLDGEISRGHFFSPACLLVVLDYLEELLGLGTLTRTTTTAARTLSKNIISRSDYSKSFCMESACPHLRNKICDNVVDI